MPRQFRVSALASDGGGPASENSDNADKQKQQQAPLSPESPSGILLEQLLQSHPHLVPAAAEQQLEHLAAQETEASANDGGKTSSSDLVLYKRMAEVRQGERVRAIKEVMYALVVQKFIECGAPLLPKVPFVAVDPSSTLFPSAATSPFGLDLVPTVQVKEKELTKVHSEEAMDMVREHLSTILGPRPTLGGVGGAAAALVNDDRVVVGTSKLRLGQVYAASIMYGYFLRRVDQRFQLEKSVGLLKGFNGKFSGLEGVSFGDRKSVV